MTIYIKSCSIYIKSCSIFTKSSQFIHNRYIYKSPIYKVDRWNIFECTDVNVFENFDSPYLKTLKFRASKTLKRFFSSEYIPIFFIPTIRGRYICKLKPRRTKITSAKNVTCIFHVNHIYIPIFHANIYIK